MLNILFNNDSTMVTKKFQDTLVVLNKDNITKVELHMKKIKSTKNYNIIFHTNMEINIELVVVALENVLKILRLAGFKYDISLLNEVIDIEFEK